MENLGVSFSQDPVLGDYLKTPAGEAELNRLATALTDSNWRIAQPAAEALGMLGDSRAVEPLVRALKSTDRRVRDAASEALIRLKDPHALDVLPSVLSHPNALCRRSAVEVLGSFGDAREVDLLSAALKDSDLRVRKVAVKSLAKTGDPRAVVPLIEALSDETVHLEAIVALGEREDTRAVDPLIEKLKGASNIQKAAAEALGMLGDTRAVGPLIRVLADTSNGANSLGRCGAAFALGQLGDARAVEPLIVAFKGFDGAVREEAGLALRRLREIRPADVVKFALLTMGDPDNEVRTIVAGMLSEMGEPIGISIQRGLSGDQAAVNAIFEAKDPRVTEPLINLLKEGKPETRKAAAKMLGGQGDRAITPLIAAINDVDTGVRKSAVEALGQLGNPRAEEPLIQVLGDPDADFRRAVASALSLVGEPVGLLVHRCLSGEREAMIALSELADSRAVRSVIRALSNQDMEVRHAAAETLVVLGDQAVEPLIAALKDPDRQTRNSAARNSAADALGKLPRSDDFLKAIVQASGSWHWRSRMVALRLLVSERHPFTGRFISQCVQVFLSAGSVIYSGMLLILVGIPLGRRWRSGSGKTGIVPGWAGWVSLGSFLVTGVLYGGPLFTGSDAELSSTGFAYWFLILLSLTPAWLALTGSLVQGAIRWPKTERRVWGFLCRADFSRFEPRAHTWLQRLSGGSVIHDANWEGDLAVAYACRLCGQQGSQFTGIRRVVVVLDNQGVWVESAHRGTLQVNWLAHRKPFDFDTVEVVSATDEEVEAFTNQMRFESEERIASRLLKMDCRVHVQCDLKDGTIRLLRLTFGKVVRK